MSIMSKQYGKYTDKRCLVYCGPLHCDCSAGRPDLYDEDYLTQMYAHFEDNQQKKNKDQSNKNFKDIFEGL